MRTSLVPGASPLRRSVRIVAVAVLGAGLVLTGSSAYACDAPGFKSFDGKQYGADEVRHADGGKRGWSREVYEVDKGVCPTAEKTQGHRATEHKAGWRGATTIAVKAPRGEVIESYCIETEDGEARVVVLDGDEQVEEVTAAYSDRKGGDKKIKRVVACSKKKGSHTKPSPSPSPTETATPEPSASPVAEVPPVEPSSTPTSSETPTPAESPSENPSTPDPTPSEEPAATESPEPSPSESAVALVVAEPQDGGTPTPEAARLAATDEVADAATDDATEAADRVQDAGRLAFTGAEVTGVFVAAVVLIALGTLAIQASRRRAAGR
ncbi:hypothetical protein Xcel_2643 [Xylanimonas cellulosilytica DSM 15894]|uniref:Rhodanese domain-containing protein n=1 Tax=Xylanimonas cellulosilytica (strain DSM 15894 / JCM 12276 / CECT 5975 / KCTC 9989 / LMG 20990 / NBRC 107835 / XIL07) TaxID=446471 RepID=D1BX89_XYLCX|nr:hypothetical protein [Xylanimonas cellulosilytica]ACZ31657.1 hypothetical protein Xcel_2643 [Xylanimonas cellulosilytica DSM 15894]